MNSVFFRGLFILAALFVVAGGMMNPIDRVRPDAPELAPFGPFPVGVQTRMLVDGERLDILNVAGNARPVYDRPLTIELWYPAVEGTVPRGTYTAILRDGQTEVTLSGRAVRDAAPVESGSFPLVILSHGYPGNRYLMSHLGENLASKGYVVASIDHTDSTYSDQAAFGSTLYNRPLDQAFVLDSLAASDDPVTGLIDDENVGIIGYSMGGYGALIFGGAGVTQASTELTWGTPEGLLSLHLAGTETHEALMDERLKAVITIGPWGKNAGFWDAEGMAGLRKPTLIMAGGADDVSVYPAMRAIFDEAVRTDRHLLTFDHANHNAAAPIPAPLESWKAVDNLDFVPFEHYADAVWDTTRMNNIAQHFATAFLDLHLKGQAEKSRYFDLVTKAEDGVVALDENGQPTDDHTYWAGFAPRTAAGLRFETKLRGE